MSQPRAGHVLLAPDKFKGSLSAIQVATHLKAGLLRAVPELTVTIASIADGGEGTVDAATASGFHSISVAATGPLGDPVQARIAVRGDTAVIEMAQASGLQLLAGRTLDPLSATSYGTGELIRAALDAGCRTIILGIGGSASTDGGAGMVRALGAELRDRDDVAVTGGVALQEIHGVDLSVLDKRIAGSKFIIATDVANVLLGSSGAAAVFAPQKGASADQVDVLEQGMSQWAAVIAAEVGQDYSNVPGAGAAGGVGFAAMAVLGAQPRPGIELILELIGFSGLLDGVGLVITGEGSLDEQSLAGKAPIGVCRAAQGRSVPTVAVAGRTTLSSVTLAAAGFAATYTLQAIEPDLDRCIADAGPLLETVAAIIADEWAATLNANSL